MYWINKPYVRSTANATFTASYLPNETYSLYINSDRLITDVHIGNYALFLIKPDGTQVFDFGTLSQIATTTNNGTTVTYDIYLTFNFPVVPDGQYYFQIFNTNITPGEICRSNLVLVQRDCFNNTCNVKARHNDQIYGYRFDLLPDFYLRYRLPINQIKPVEFESERDQYRESSNGRNLRNSKSFRDMKLTLEFYFANDEDHQALSAILEMDEVYIDGFRIIDLKQIETQEVSPFSAKSKATFEILLDEYNIDYSATSPLSGKRILYGGDSIKLSENSYAGTI